MGEDDLEGGRMGGRKDAAEKIFICYKLLKTRL